MIRATCDESEWTLAEFTRPQQAPPQYAITCKGGASQSPGRPGIDAYLYNDQG
jgi:hypothetical protein